MFIDTLSIDKQNAYRQLLSVAGMISGLFSENTTPYITPRHSEKMFCKATGAQDRGRDDTSADATYRNIGIGIKTFINGNGNSMQKVAEFDGDAYLFRDELPENKIRIVANLRNERIRSTKRMYGLDTMIYHCIVRSENRIQVFEEDMDEVDVNSISNIQVRSNGSSISFRDRYNEYTFNVNKSTLNKRFVTQNILIDLPINILEDPFSVLNDLLLHNGNFIFEEAVQYPSVILPLFSDRGGRNVPEKSGLNQWHADGRPRDDNEIYIPIPAWIHQRFPGFFPDRDHIFTLHLPNNAELSAKVCQQGSKALMTNPNAALGQWLLRDVMAIPPRTLLTYEDLQRLNIDSVEIYKMSDDEFSISFRPLGTFDAFAEEHNI